MKIERKKVSLKDKLEQFSEYWTPHIVGELNGQHVKVAKLLGEFVWHQHQDEDELFLVITGHLAIHLRDQVVDLHPGEFFIVPRGVEHKPVAAQEVEVLLFEPCSTVNTGETQSDLLVPAPKSI